MNANELADELDKCMEDGSTDLVCVEQAATMLRQQQEKLTKYELRHVAQRDRIAILEMQHKQQQAEIESLKAKTLTDEEISDVINNEFGHKFNGYEICFLYAFARAILRKASE